jgi:integrase
MGSSRCARGRTSRGVSEATIENYRRSIEEHAIPYFRRYKLADVEPPDVRALVAHLEEQGLAPASVRNRIAPLRAMFATALEDGALRSNPTLGVRVNGRRQDESEEEHEARTLTREQLRSVLAELPDEWRLFFEFLAHSGLRISEAIGLTWGDVKFGERPQIKLRSQLYQGRRRRLKSAYGRRDIPLAPGMARKLWRLRGSRPEDEPVFATGKGTPLNPSNVRSRILKPAAERAGLEWAVGFHTFRHTCASLLFEAGRNVKQVSDWLGHHDPAFTLSTYVHLMDEGIGSADFLDDAVGNSWATQHPETAAKETVREDAASASESRIGEQPKAAATPGGNSRLKVRVLHGP